MATSEKRSRTPEEGPIGSSAVEVDTACPLDCPDACSLSVTVRRGRVVKIDGSRKNPVTDGYICAKVRRFGDRVYGPDRVLYPAIRKGRKGEGTFKRVTWDQAFELLVQKFQQAKTDHGAASILQDRLAIVIGAEPDIEAGMDAAGHPAFAPEEAVRQAFERRNAKGPDGHTVGFWTKPAAITPGVSSTRTASTRDAGGPRCRRAISSSILSGAPAATASTDPSWRLRTQPSRPSSLACSIVQARNQTP